MADRTLSWTLPPVGPRQLPIDHVRLEMNVDPAGFPWTELGQILPDAAQELVLVDVNPGDIYYRAVVVDTAGQESRNPPVIVGSAPFDPPGEVLNFTVMDTG